MNNEKKPILSLCIPTYNRAKYLKKCLDSIVNSPVFDDDEIEIVISDNASTDNTRAMAEAYSSRYRFISYYRNEKNIHDKNFPAAISKANGIFRKLLNDTSLLHEESLWYMLDAVKKNTLDKPVLFFSNNEKLKDKIIPITCFSLKDFIGKASYYMTWIGSFGIWEDDFFRIEDKFAGCEKNLWQTEKLLELVANGKISKIYPCKIMAIQSVENKNLGYGVFRVYINNYIKIISYYKDCNQISVDDFEREVRRLLFGYFADHFVNMIFTPRRYSKNGWVGLCIFVKYYSKRWYFILFPFGVFINLFFRVAKKIINYAS